MGIQQQIRRKAYANHLDFLVKSELGDALHHLGQP